MSELQAAGAVDPLHGALGLAPCQGVPSAGHDPDNLLPSFRRGSVYC
jgi:hypothetical protein